mmetsp:Transcript_4862/g.8653  ORF Transcript_4862/g.8653 Transcript_4862/m.8653 type:complete len:522 (+) Transcript_4862:265-1830(+)
MLLARQGKGALVLAAVMMVVLLLRLGASTKPNRLSGDSRQGADSMFVYVNSDRSVDAKQLSEERIQDKQPLPETMKDTEIENTLQPPLRFVRGISTKYLIYTPSGGFNNQLICLLIAIKLGKAMDRTVVVPPAASHHNLYKGYLGLDMQELIPMNHVLDFDYMQESTGVKMIPLQIPLPDFLKNNFGSKVLSGSEHLKTFDIRFGGGFTEKSVRFYNSVVDKAKASKEQSVLFYGRFYCNKVQVAKLFSKIRYSDLLMRNAENFVKYVLGTERYSSMHLRLGDKSFLLSRFGVTKESEGESFSLAVRQMEVDPSGPLYLSTDGAPQHNSVQIVKKNFPNIYMRWWDYVPEHPEMQDAFDALDSLLPAKNLKFDMFGLVEQLICVRSVNFVGSGYSTYTKTIVRFRSYLYAVYPIIAKNALDDDRTHVLVHATGRREVTVYDRVLNENYLIENDVTGLDNRDDTLEPNEEAASGKEVETEPSLPVADQEEIESLREEEEREATLEENGEQQVDSDITVQVDR